MDESYTRWRDSAAYRVGNTSIIISDSDEDVVDNSRSSDTQNVIDESHEDDTEATPKMNKVIISDDDDDNDTPILVNRNKKKYNELNFTDSYDDSYDREDDDSNENSNNEEYHSSSDSDSAASHSLIKLKGKKRKDITHDNTREDIKESRLNSSSDSFTNMHFPNTDNSNGQNKSDYNKVDMENKTNHDVPVTIELGSSDSNSGRNSDSEYARSFAEQEVGVKDMNPLRAQERAITVCKLNMLKNETAQMKLLLAEGNLEALPDKGQKLQECIRQQEEEIRVLTHKLENIPSTSSNNRESDRLRSHFEEASGSVEDDSYAYNPYLDIDGISIKPTTSPELRELGKKAQATRDMELALTVDRLQDLHGSLVARPSETEKAEDPRGLKVSLMPHQQHALAWLLWREQQKPPGGILADDMGLGKTLTMIALIIKTLDQKDFEYDKSDKDDSDDDDDEWRNRNKSLRSKGGTLVVCPASLLSQWEGEVRNRCKRGLLSIEVYHGNNRQTVPKRLAKNDMVITTYNILSREHKTNSTLFKIKWKRCILDEAHVVRNHKSQASEAVCALLASKRWALTGTPIQNKELDLYSILKYLKCSPFNDLRVWKRWVDNKNAAGHQRLATLMKALMLRRTKQELMAKGEIENLPDKSIEEVIVNLDRQEQLVYEKILIYSRTLFAQFLAQRAEKQHAFDLYSGKYDKPAYLSNPNKETQFTKAQNKLLAMHADVKAHEILVLLLRLRQICCHPALIHAMLDREDVQQCGIMDTDTNNEDADLLSRVNRISLNALSNVEDDIGVDQRVTGNLLTAENPVFDNDRTSSKMKVLLNTVKEILEKGNDKIIIVSQWANLLDVIGLRLSTIKGATFSKLTGSVAIKDRHNVIEAFNSKNCGPRILLLSLTAGGVGLNLVGGNHLLLFDIHWNPQLESQAQDRIYRFGQAKNVYIYKFICVNTIEERIKALQERKLEIAKNVLSGDKSNTAMKLTLNDLKSLFGF
ncbi:hypothetical protein PUN28_000943 [Cardiocondyla obscurior]|uniref:Transcription termination factor 2 n=1 Tax=Cardiocondyla obscurior TaxID=286306 RepID=A0AAW2H2D8_9HYME